MQARAVIFDFIGTLTNVRNYNLNGSVTKLYKALFESGFQTSQDEFLKAYNEAHEKYRIIRYEKLVEVTNAVWISEALNSLGFDTTPENPQIGTALKLFFKDYVDSFELRPCAKELLQEVSFGYKVGLVSNFTNAPVIYAGLRKLDISKFLNAVLVSDETGWRKPNLKIFYEALKRLNVRAEETLYVGDSPLEDIKGAKAVGMKTVFVPSQFYTMENLKESQQEPDKIVKDLCELKDKLPEILSAMI